MTDLLEIGRAVLQKQPFSLFLGAELLSLETGRATLGLDIRPEFLQQQGFVHGGVVSYLIDNALTFAGGSTLGENVVTAEYKLNYLRPARGRRLVATATVDGKGARLAVCRCEVKSLEEGAESLCAVGQGTVMMLNSGA